MSLEQELKDAFARHADDVPARADAWAAVERGVRRAHVRRVGLVSAAAVAAVVAVAVTVPQLLSAPSKPGGFVGPGGTESPQPSPLPPAEDRVTRVGVEARFRIEIPRDWKGGWFEGSWDFEPQGLPSLAEGGDTAAIGVTLEQGSYADVPVARPLEWRDAQVAGRDAKRAEETVAGDSGESHLVHYRVDWTEMSGACPRLAPCPVPAPDTLRVELIASTPDLWSHYGELAEKVIHTLAVYDGSEPVHGTVAPGVTMDQQTWALVRFLDARVEGVGAEDGMTSNASEQYGRNEGGLGLYDVEGRRYTDYEIQFRNDADARSAEFQVSLGFEQREVEQLVRIIETIGVGPGTTLAGDERAAVIRFARFVE